MDVDMHEAPGSGQEDTHRPEMEAAAQSAPQAKLSVLEILNMKGGNKRFSIDLILVEAKHCNADGEPVPQEHPFNSQIHQLVLLGQDYEGEQITVEASGDDLSWLKKIAACMRLRQTVTLQNPAFSPSNVAYTEHRVVLKIVKDRSTVTESSVPIKPLPIRTTHFANITSEKLATVECQVIYIGRTGKIKIRGVDKIIRKIAAKDMTGVVRSLAFWGEYAYTPLIEEGAAMKTVACITGLRYDPEQGYSTTRSMVFPGTVSAATFSAVPFTLTTASFRDIDSWLPTIGSLPTSQYVNKLIVATPMKIDVDIQPTCPSCEADAEAVLDSQTDYYCTQQCDWYQEHGPFQPISKVSGTFRLNIDDGPCAFPTKVFAPDFATLTGYEPEAFAQEGYLDRIRLLEARFLHKKRAFHVRVRKGNTADRTLIALAMAEELPSDMGSPSKKSKPTKTELE